MCDIRIAGVTKDSIVDGPGLRYTVFVQGCNNNCEGCHNPQTHDPKGGYLTDVYKLYDEFMKNPLYSGITFSGGEPFLQADALYYLARMIKIINPEKTIICYTGYTYEYLIKYCQEANGKYLDKSTAMSYYGLLHNIDYLIDGPFIKSKASLECKWRGSTNQRIIDVKASKDAGYTAVEVDI